MRVFSEGREERSLSCAKEDGRGTRGEAKRVFPGRGLKFFAGTISRRRSQRDFYCVFGVNSTPRADSGFISLRLHG